MGSTHIRKSFLEIKNRLKQGLNFPLPRHGFAPRILALLGAGEQAVISDTPETSATSVLG